MKEKINNLIKVRKRLVLLIEILIILIAIIVLLMMQIFKGRVISKNEAQKLVEKHYFADIAGKDIIQYGFDDESRLTNALLLYKKKVDSSYNEEDNTYAYNKNELVDIKKIAKEDKNVILKNKSYMAKMGNNEYIFQFVDIKNVSYIPYNVLNKFYKELYNTDAPKQSVTNRFHYLYFYSPIVDGYFEMVGGVGAVFEPTPIHIVNSVKKQNGKIIVSVDYFDYQYSIKDENKIIITKKGTDYKKEFLLKDSIYEDIYKDVSKENKNLIKKYQFIFEQNDKNYYLKDIKKQG